MSSQGVFPKEASFDYGDNLAARSQPPTLFVSLNRSAVQHSNIMLQFSMITRKALPIRLKLRLSGPLVAAGIKETRCASTACVRPLFSTTYHSSCTCSLLRTHWNPIRFNCANFPRSILPTTKPRCTWQSEVHHSQNWPWRAQEAGDTHRFEG